MKRISQQMAKRFINLSGSHSDPRTFRRGALCGVLLSLFWLSSCTGQSAKNRFLLAEELWHEGKYQASVAEYEKVMQKEESSDLALQAAYRAALTETLFLNNHLSAIRKLNRIIDLKKTTPLAHDAYRQLGEILYTRLEQHEQAVAHYGKMVALFPDDPEIAEYLFRVGKSQFYLLKFDDSIGTYRRISQQFPQSPVAEKAFFEIGVSMQTKTHQLGRAEGNNQAGFREAIAHFSSFLKTYPASPRVPQAKFEMGGCYEELDQIDVARQIYEEIRTTHPTPHLVQTKLKRLDERKVHKNL